MPRLKNRLHERFAWLIAEGMDRKTAYAEICPYVSDPATQGYRLYHRPEVKSRIGEIQSEVHCRSLMAIDEKRDPLRQMIEGTIPTKLTRKRDGTVEAVYDMLAALIADAKMAWRIRRSQPSGKGDGGQHDIRGLPSEPPESAAGVDAGWPDWCIDRLKICLDGHSPVVCCASKGQLSNLGNKGKPRGVFSDFFSDFAIFTTLYPV